MRRREQHVMNSYFDTLTRHRQKLIESWSIIKVEKLTLLKLQICLQTGAKYISFRRKMDQNSLIASSHMLKLFLTLHHKWIKIDFWSRYGSFFAQCALNWIKIHIFAYFINLNLSSFDRNQSWYIFSQFWNNEFAFMGYWRITNNTATQTRCDSQVLRC